MIVSLSFSLSLHISSPCSSPSAAPDRHGDAVDRILAGAGTISCCNFREFKDEVFEDVAFDD